MTTEQIKKQVGKNLKEARETKGLTQEKIATILQTKQTIYSRYETARTELDYEKIIKICILLEITPNDLFENCF